MAFFKLTIAYDGADFSGWQSQPGRRTVQGEVERAWREITGETVRVTAAGRTDAGVHARGQVVGVESATLIPPAKLVLALNARLPADAAVRSVEPAHDGFHATTEARRKRYRYTIFNDRRRPVFTRRYAWHVPMPLDVAAMHAGAQHLVGTHDFVSFQSAGSERETTVRTLFAAEVAGRAGGAKPDAAGPPPPSAPGSARGLPLAAANLFLAAPNPRPEAGAESHPRLQADGDETDALITIDIEGDGFLYNMVRTIAGTLVEVGRGRRDPAWVADVLAARRRTAAGQTAPPQGLAMLWVAY